jgi:purine-binding chemotaxis protein CheW
MTTVPASPVAARRWCTFRIGDACFGVDTAAVVEVLRGRGLTRVPLAAEGVLGLVHLRGRIVPVIDPAVRLAVEPGPVGGPKPQLVMALGDDWYGFAVDEMLDVIEIPPERVELPAAGAEHHEAVAGTFAADHRLVHLLDPEHLIHSLVRQPPLPPTRLGGPHA